MNLWTAEQPAIQQHAEKHGQDHKSPYLAIVLLIQKLKQHKSTDHPEKHIFHCDPDNAMCCHSAENSDQIIHQQHTTSKEHRLSKQLHLMYDLHTAHYLNSRPSSDSPWDPFPLLTSEYWMESIFPDRSTSPFSRVSRFTCRSIPRIISIPISVSSKISLTSKDKISDIPFNAQVPRFVKMTLCCLDACLSSI